MSEAEVNKAKLRFDGTVHFGHLLIILGFAISAFTAYSAIRNDLNNHDWRLVNLEKSFESQGRTNAELRDSLNSIGRDIAVIRTKVDRVEGTITAK